MRYIVTACEIQCEEETELGAGDGGDAVAVTTMVTLCEDAEAVFEAVKHITDLGEEWAVFEVLPDGKTRQRALIFPTRTIV